MSDPRPTMEGAKEAQWQRGRVTECLREMGADAFYAYFMERIWPREGVDQLELSAALAVLHSRLHHLEGYKMVEDESPWKPFSERWPAPDLPILVRSGVDLWAYASGLRLLPGARVDEINEKCSWMAIPA
jgi:hypothetical protein